MNKIIVKTRILEFLANTILPAFEELKDQLGIQYSDYKETPWKAVVDNDTPTRLMGLPLKLCELDFNHMKKDFTVVLTVQILSEEDIGGFFSICWDQGTMCAKELFFDELTELDSQKIINNLKSLLESLSRNY